MQASDLDRATLRRLAEARSPDGGLVVSVYLSLDPSEFATPPARATAIRSLLDDAARRAEATEGLGHDARRALREDLERVRAALEEATSPQGAQALALFASAPAGLFELIRLPRPVGSDVVLDRSPFVEPLAALAGSDRSWAVLLANRRTARILQGTAAALAEVERLQSDVPGQHSQGGTQQRARERAVDQQKDEHLERAAQVLFRRSRRRGFDRLLVGAPPELVGQIERALHPYLRDRLAGRVEVDVENSSPEAVLDDARPVMEDDDARREREAVERMREGVSTGGRGAAGLTDTLAALSEHRVETLLIDDGFAAPGVRCPACRWLGADRDTCPADGTELERRDDVVEDAVERALAQSADVLVVRRTAELGAHGGIGAVLRF